MSERLHQDRLGLVLLANDFDHLVEAEIGDQEAAEHFHTMLDFLEPEAGASHQHIALVVEPLAQHFGSHLRYAALHQHFPLSGMRLSARSA